MFTFVILNESTLLDQWIDGFHLTPFWNGISLSPLFSFESIFHIYFVSKSDKVVLYFVAKTQIQQLEFLFAQCFMNQIMDPKLAFKWFNLRETVIANPLQKKTCFRFQCGWMDEENPNGKFTDSTQKKTCLSHFLFLNNKR